MQQRAADMGSRSLRGPDDWARDALARLDAIPDVTRVGLALTEGGGRRLLFVSSDRGNDPGMDWCYVDAYADIPLNTAVRTGHLVAGSLEELAGTYAEFVGRQSPAETQAIAAVPIRGAGQTLGGFVVFYRRPQRFDNTQRDQLSAFGTQLGVHLRRAQRTRSRVERWHEEEPAPHDDALVASHEVPAHPAAVGAARRFLTETLSAWGVDDETTITAELCLSELVTNALIHTHAGCRVRVVLDRGVLTTSVRDSGSAVIERTDLEDPLQVHGRGLQVVDALAARWGSDLDEVGTTVWFVLELPRRSAPRQRRTPGEGRAHGS